MAPVELNSSGQGPEARPRLVRSYTITAGRTRSAVALPLEARLRRLEENVDEGADTPRLQVLRICDRRSVAEVSALARMPVGVVRVLLGDLVGAGAVQVQATLGSDATSQERRTLIERTLRGLRAL